MPVIHTHVSVSTTPEQREALKSAYGKAITAVPGKSEGWLMCPFEDNMPIYFGGDDSKPAAYVEVNVFGRSVPGSAWEKLTEQIMAALEKELGIPADRTYIRYTATTDWGWNGGHLRSFEVRPYCEPLTSPTENTPCSPPHGSGRQLLTKFLPFLRGHGVATFARNRRN